MQQIIIPENEKRQLVFSWFGEASCEEAYEVILAGDRSEVDVYGVFYGNGSARYSNNVKVIHRGEDTRANVFACGVAVDSSFIDFSGMLRVEHGAKRTRTFFRANLMILSKQAGAYTFPGLEIEENDILQGGHAATVGKVNEEQMFYLMSRGLSESVSKKLVIQGFFGPVLAFVNNDDGAKITDKLRSILKIHED
jgi:Fe-S cluster assembly protein SufD